MAASQKKTGGKRTSSGGTRRSGSASGSSRGNSRGSKAPARRPMRREIGAAVCLALALFAALGYFHIQAIFIDFFSGLLKGLLGYGFWLMPPALLLAAYILAFHRGRPVRLELSRQLEYGIVRLLCRYTGAEPQFVFGGGTPLDLSLSLIHI